MIREPKIAQKTSGTHSRVPSSAPSRRNSNGVQHSGAAALQQRFGNQGARTLAAQVIARSAKPGVASTSDATAGQLSISQPGDAHEREADRVADVVIRTTVARSSISPSIPTMQRACAHCEEAISTREPAATGDTTNVHRSASAGEPGQVSAPVAASIHNMQGGGAPLPAATRAFFEPRFGANFSKVRVHTDTHAARTASAINAKAFTVGGNIAFAPGQYAPHSGEGQRLLAHELTHVVQQSETKASMVQRDDEPGAQPGADEPAAGPVFVPEAVVEDLLNLLEQEYMGDEEAFAAQFDEDLSEEEKKLQRELAHAADWLGDGPSADRKILLLRSEDIRLDNAGYRESIINKFGSEDYPKEMYLGWLMDTYDAPSRTEQGTMSKLNENMPALALTDSNFIDKAFIQRWDGGNAFPDYAWNIVKPLVSPSEVIRNSVASDRRATQTSMTVSWGELGWDLYENGVPASYSRSLSISEYSAVKSKAVSKLLKMPDRSWIYQHFILPEEIELHTAVMKSYTGNVTLHVLAELQHGVLEKWSAATGVRWPYFDAFAISSFRTTHPSGLGSIEEFYNYAQKGLGLGAGLTVAKIKAQIQTSGVNPYLFLGRVSGEAQGIAPNLIKQLNADELQNFKNTLENADRKIVALGPALRLMTAVEWSIKKGFAAQGIVGLLQNLDTILWEILKEYAKEKAVKKAIMTGVSYLGPWGRTISIIYNIMDFFDDVRDKIELALLVKSFVETLDEAKNSQSIVTTQQASAKLAQAYETTFQLLIQKLGAKLLSKLSAATAKKLKEKRRKGEKMGDAERTNLIEGARNELDAKKLKPEYLEAEFETAKKSSVSVSGDTIEIVLPNGHRWKRNRGAKGWCRESGDCVSDFLNPELTDELDGYAKKQLPRDFPYDDYPSLLDDPRVHQTSKGNFGEVVSDHMLSKNYDNLGGITHMENPDRGPGIDNVWRPRDQRHFDYSVSETKFVQGFDGDLHRVKMGKTKSGPQLSDSWITGKDFNTMKKRLEEAIGEEMAKQMRSSVDKNRVERLLIVVNETGRTWVYEVHSSGEAYKLKTD
jgi:hypothetical protein